MKKNRRGAVLIVVLAVLVILALLAATFASLQSLDRTVSRNYLDDVRAKMLAQSGVEYAVNELRDLMSNGFFASGTGSRAWMYWGDDVTETVATPAPVETCKNPSISLENEPFQNPNDANVAPKLLKLKRNDGSVIDVGISRAMETGRYAPNGDVYTLRIVDASGMIYVNDGLYQFGGNNSTVSQNLRRILNNLGAHPTVAIPGLGDAVLNNRGMGYSSKYELRKAVGFNDTLFNKFKDFVTTHAWVDKNVVNPVPLSAQTASLYPIQFWRGNGPLVYRRGRGSNNLWQDRYAAEPLVLYQPGNPNPNHNAIYALDELFPQYVEVVWRAPVNVNSAPEPVLTSLLADVGGFFAIERRRNAPYAGSPPSFTYTGPGYSGSPITVTIDKQYYTWHYVQHTFDATGSEGDETGHLYRTAPIEGPWVASGSGVPAQILANHIIACRSGSTFGGINYAALPFGGPFRSWAQFDRFLENLVEQGVLWDSRQIYVDYNAANAPVVQPANSGSNKFASHALADAIKANFNPNCTLNETNPDRNRYLRVDKTDLIVNSTEFCFTPMGYYEIESLGRVLRPQENSGIDIFASTGNVVVAEKKILASVKLYDVHRESTQRHFYGGTLALRQTNPETCGNRSVQIGPEVDNGPLVHGDLWNLSAPATYTQVLDGYSGAGIQTGWGYEYGGHLQLPTYGGNLQAGVKPPSTLWTTPAGGAHIGSVIHAHYDWDFKAHHHQSAIAHGNDWFRDELGSVLRFANNFIDQIPYSKPAKIERALNFNDRGEAVLSPYCTAYDTKYREARSFRLPLQPTSGSGVIPFDLAEYAPSDLRIDGPYSERHSGIAYWIDQGHSWNEQGGMLAAWIKPSFFPEHTGKMRKVFGMSRWHAKNFGYRNPNLWDMFYVPAHDVMPYQVSGTEGMAAAYVGNPFSTGNDAPPEGTGGKGVYPFRPMSLNSTWGAHCYDGSLADMFDEGPWLEQENYSCTPSLNHRLHGGAGESAKANLLDKGKWTHVVLRWNEQTGSFVPTQNHLIQTFVNGIVPAGSTNPYAGSIFTSSFKRKYFTIQSFSDSATGKWLTNTVRLGECSSHGFGTFNRNYSADMTFDEFYVWKDNGTQSVANALQLWQRGRYYRPTWGNTADSVFTSKSIDLDLISPPRSCAPATTGTTPPYATGTVSATMTALPAPKRRLLGVAWTWYAEDYVKAGTKLVPILYNHANPNSPAPMFQADANGNPEASARVFVLADGQKFPLSDPNGYTNDGFSPIVGADGKPYEVTNAADIKYQVWFQIRGCTPSTVLLATPVFDDVTLYYDQGDVEFLLYALVNTI